MAVAYFNDAAVADAVWGELKKLDPDATYTIGVNCVYSGFDYMLETSDDDGPDYLVDKEEVEVMPYWRACF